MSGQMTDDDDDDTVSSYTSSSSIPMTDSIRTDRLPSIEGTSALSDLSSAIFECPMCPREKKKMMTFVSLIQHVKWHGRVNLLTHLRTMMKREVETLPFGPSSLPGVLFKSEYYKFENKVLGVEVTEGDARNLLRLFSKEPLVTLSYGEGRKYTFGTKFLSRESQGDFLYFDVPLGEDDNDDDDVEENYFQLECKEEGLWISYAHVEGCRGRGPSTILSVNGTPLLGNETASGRHSSRKLEFGDVVTISIGDDGESVSRYVDLLFKASSPKSVVKSLVGGGDLEERKNLLKEKIKSAVDNPLILENILGFLSLKTLQSLRSVSHLWNTEALKVLRSRVVVSICALKQKGNNTTAQSLLQTSDYAHSQLNQLHFPNWNIVLPKGEQQEEAENAFMFMSRSRGGIVVPNVSDKAERMEDQKILSDLTWLLKSQNHHVKSLQLGGRLSSGIRFQMFESVLTGLGGSSLTSLSLHINCSQTLPSAPMEELKALKFLSLAMDSTKNDTRDLKRFLQWLLPGVKGIGRLYVVDACITDCMTIPRRVYFASLVLQQMAGTQSKGETFPTLTHVTVAGPSQEQLPLPSLRPGSLRKVDMVDLGTGKSYIRGNLGGHSETLQELTLHFNFPPFPSQGLEIDFPERMPNLNSLSIYFAFNLGSSFNGPPVRFRFGGRVGRDTVSSIDYNRHFPSLSKLTVWPVDANKGLSPNGVVKDSNGRDWGTFLPVLTPFLQILAVHGPAPEVKILDVPFTLKGKYHSALDNLETIFPNVPFPAELTAARQGPLYAEGEREDSSESEDDDDDVSLVDSDEEDESSYED